MIENFFESVPDGTVAVTITFTLEDDGNTLNPEVTSVRRMTPDDLVSLLMIALGNINIDSRVLGILLAAQADALTGGAISTMMSAGQAAMMMDGIDTELKNLLGKGNND